MIGSDFRVKLGKSGLSLKKKGVTDKGFPRDYDLLAVKSGKIKISSQGQEVLVSKGEAYLLLPNEFSQTEHLEKTELAWLHFSIQNNQGTSFLVDKKIPKEYRFLKPSSSMLTSFDYYFKKGLASEMLLETELFQSFFKPWLKGHEVLIPLTGWSLAEMVLSLLRKDPQYAFSVNEMAEREGCHPMTFSKHFKAETNLSLASFVFKERLKLLEKTFSTKTTATEKARFFGFSDASAFSKAYLREMGKRPGSSNH